MHGAILRGCYNSKRGNKTNKFQEQGVLLAHNIFGDEEMSNVLGKIVLEHTWNEPHGTGEISLIDNRTILHSSYYEKPTTTKSYKIGVRYVK